MRIALIVAVARNGVIGRNGGLAWKISDDLKWFKSTTMGKPIVMGRKTFDSIRKPLPGRTNIVVSRTMGDVDGVIVERSVADALNRAAECGRESGLEEIFVIGGAEIYARVLPRADRIYLTEVDADVEGDVRFPPIDPKDWTRRLVGSAEQSARNDHGCAFFILDRN